MRKLGGKTPRKTKREKSMRAQKAVFQAVRGTALRSRTVQEAEAFLKEDRQLDSAKERLKGGQRGRIQALLFEGDHIDGKKKVDGKPKDKPMPKLLAQKKRRAGGQKSRTRHLLRSLRSPRESF